MPIYDSRVFKLSFRQGYPKYFYGCIDVLNRCWRRNVLLTVMIDIPRSTFCRHPQVINMSRLNSEEPIFDLWRFFLNQIEILNQ